MEETEAAVVMHVTQKWDSGIQEHEMVICQVVK